MESFLAILKKPYVRRILIFVLMIILLIWLRSMLSIFLLTFMFVYIGNSIQKWISRIYLRIFKRKANSRVIVVCIYALVLFALVVLLWIYIPLVGRQISAIISELTTYFSSAKKNGASAAGGVFSLDSIISFVSNHVDISKYVSSGGTAVAHSLTNIGTASINIFISLILSLFLLLGKQSVHTFFRQFKGSKLHWMYDDVRYFSHKFSDSFGNVIQTQLLISLINTTISAVALLIMGFPSIIGLAAMIFVLGMVPVVGVFISLIPLSIIGYATGGISKVIWVLILIAVLHVLEGYVLNPKLMSHKTRMPVAVTFLVLLIAEHVIGIWGLVIGLPITVFLLDVLEVLPSDDSPDRDDADNTDNGSRRGVQPQLPRLPYPKSRR